MSEEKLIAKIKDLCAEEGYSEPNIQIASSGKIVFGCSPEKPKVEYIGWDFGRDFDEYYFKFKMPLKKRDMMPNELGEILAKRITEYLKENERL